MTRLLSFKSLIAGSLVAVASHAGAATIPYTETFDDGVADGFNTVSAYTIQDGGGGKIYQAIIGPTSGSSSASSAVELPGVAGSNFRVSSQFTIDSFNTGTDSTLNLGIGILGTSTDFTSGVYRILYNAAHKTAAGVLSIQEGGTTRSSSSAAMPVVLDTPYTLTIDVTYAGLNPTINAELTRSGETPITATFTDTSPLTPGDYFGFRTAVNGSLTTVAQNIDYDNFTVTVPEPATMSLVGMGCVGLLMRRRRRA